MNTLRTPDQRRRAKPDPIKALCGQVSPCGFYTCRVQGPLHLGDHGAPEKVTGQAGLVVVTWPNLEVAAWLAEDR